MRTPSRTSFLRPAALLRLVLLCASAGLLFMLIAHAGIVGGASITGISPSSGYPGMNVTITGSTFTGATAVEFNGTPARCWTVDSDTQITAVVPFDATTGPISVRDPIGIVTSVEDFTVTAASKGKVAFHAERNGNFDIFVMNADGSGLTQLTDDPSEDMCPEFSPDRTRIVFNSARDGHQEIYVMNADGSEQTRLTMSVSGGQAYGPTFSPDGRRIAFVSDRDGKDQIFVMNADGSEQTRLTSVDAYENNPDFSPDGRQIAFSSDADFGTNIYVINVDGSGLSRLTDDSFYADNPSFSPDGGLITFISGRDGFQDIYDMNADGGEQTRISVGMNAAGFPSFSPDGTHIIFDAYNIDHYAIAVMTTDGSELTWLTDGTMNAESPSWVAGASAPPTVTGFTPSSGYPGTMVTLTGSGFTGTTGVTFNGAMACYRVLSDTELYTAVPYNATTGPITVTNFDGASSSAESFTVTRGRKGRIAFSSNRGGNRDIYIMNPDGSGQTRLTDNPSDDKEPAISPDGKRIAFVSNRDGNNQIYVMNTDGSGQTRLTVNTWDDGEPAFSPDGSRIVFCSWRDFGEDVYLMNTDGSGETQLTYSGWSASPRFSPDGQRIVFTSWIANEEILVMRVDGSEKTQLTSGSFANFDPTFSPDGSTIAFISTRDGHSEIYAMHDDGSGQVPLTSYGWAVYDPVYSPEGKRIAFTAEIKDVSSNIFVMLADGSKPALLTFHPEADEEPSWGNWPMAAPTISGFTPVSGFPGTAVTITGTHFIGTFGVFFNGTPALCWTENSDTQVTAVVPTGAVTGPITVTTDDGEATSAASFTVTEAGIGKIVYSSDFESLSNYEVYIMNPDGSGRTRLTDDPAEDTDPVLSPDGSRIAYTSEHDYVQNIYIMNADGSDKTQLTFADSWAPAFSPDGRKIVFMSGRDGQAMIYVMNVDGSQQLRVGVNLLPSDPAFSPDGRKIVFTNYVPWEYHDQIYIMNADGSDPTRLTFNLGRDGYPSFSPDGQKIVFSSDRDTGDYEIFVMDANGDNQTRLTTHNGGSTNPCFSPDGQKIAYDAAIMEINEGANNIHVMNVDGSGVNEIIAADGFNIHPSWGGGPLVYSHQPDLFLRPSTTPVDIGEGVFNLNGAGQTVGLTVANSASARYYVTVKNSGSSVDSFVITGSAAPAGCSVVYKNFSGGGGIITNAVTHAGWTTPLLAINETTVIEVTVTPGASQAGGTMIEQMITASSNILATQQDVVKIQTTVASSFLADLSLRTSVGTTYSGVGIYNLNGTDQIVSLNVSKNSVVSYFVHVQNKGNAPDTFNITGTSAPLGWSVVYKINNSGGTDITADITGTGWTTPLLNRGSLVTIAVYVIAGPSVMGNTTATQTVTATSNSDATKQDVGVIQTTTVPNVYQVDLSLRPSTLATYTGIGVYSVDGIDQSVAQSTKMNKIVSYFIHVQNKGNAPDTFTITSLPAQPGWSVVYRINNSNGMDITNDVTGAGWVTPLVNPNGLVTVAVYVIPRSVVYNMPLFLLITTPDMVQPVTATSNGDASKQDVGTIQTLILPAQP